MNNTIKVIIFTIISLTLFGCCGTRSEECRIKLIGDMSSREVEIIDSYIDAQVNISFVIGNELSVNNSKIKYLESIKMTSDYNLKKNYVINSMYVTMDEKIEDYNLNREIDNGKEKFRNRTEHEKMEKLHSLISMVINLTVLDPVNSKNITDSVLYQILNECSVQQAVILEPATISR